VLLKVWSLVNNKKAEHKIAEVIKSLEAMKGDVPMVSNEATFEAFIHQSACLSEALLASEAEVFSSIKEEESNFKDLPSLLFNHSTQICILGQNANDLIKGMVDNDLVELAPQHIMNTIGVMGALKVEGFLSNNPTKVMLLTDSTYYVSAYSGLIQIGMGTELEYSVTEAILDDEGADIEYEVVAQLANCTRIKVVAPTLILGV
jgi:hypothetical protein